MRFNVLNRKVHYWMSVGIALPLLAIVVTGLLLQLKKHSSWIQPVEYLGTSTEQPVDLVHILGSVKKIAHLEVSNWQDIRRIDVRPSKGIAKVWLTNDWEAQVDLSSGKVLHTAYRRSDLIESIHDGSIFGSFVKFGIFFSAGLALLLMLFSGLWMFIWPLLPRRWRLR
jgi:uncharacterized iron-regulated membrane protein